MRLLIGIYGLLLLLAGCTPEARMAGLLIRHPSLATTTSNDSTVVQDSAGVVVITRYRNTNRAYILDGQRARNDLKVEKARVELLRQEKEGLRQQIEFWQARAAPKFYNLSWFWVSVLLALLLGGTWYIHFTYKVR